MSSQLTAVAISVVGVAVACGMGCGGEGLPEDVGSSSEALSVRQRYSRPDERAAGGVQRRRGSFLRSRDGRRRPRPRLQRERVRHVPRRRRPGGRRRAGRNAGRETDCTSFNPLASEGGSLFQHFGIGGQVQNKACTTQGETVPATRTSRPGGARFRCSETDWSTRRPTRPSRPSRSSQPSAIRGTAPLVPNISAGRNTVGKFGWKDQNPTLFQFSGDAYVNEMGITNPQFPTENLPQEARACSRRATRSPTRRTTAPT